MTERTLATTIHGRYLVSPPPSAEPAPMLIGCHGYGENAERQLDRLRGIADGRNWLCVSIQGLNRFYERRTNGVVASWMTRQDRELTIADNVAYVAACIDAAAAEWPAPPGVVFAGFSQGVAMAFRAAVNSTRPVAGVIAVGGDIPPEIASGKLKRISNAFLARGTADNWYTSEKFAGDERRVRECGVNVRALEFDGGHEWSAEVVAAAKDFLRSALADSQP